MMPKLVSKTALRAVAGILSTLATIWTEDIVILGWTASLGDSYRVRYAFNTILRYDIQKLICIRGFVMKIICMHIS
jgi:hypothetical protein